MAAAMDALIQLAGELAKNAKSDGFIEVVMRDGKKRFKKYLKLPINELVDKDNNPLDALDKLLNTKNLANLGKFNIALDALNMVATIASTIIICSELSSIRDQVDELKDSVDKLKDMQFEVDIARPCREMLDEYKIISNKLERNSSVSEGELVKLIRDLNSYLITLYNLRDKCDLHAVLDMIFSLLPVYSNCIMIYYEKFYDAEQERHPLHDSWMSVYDKLSSYSFIDQVQDYMFIDQHQTNAQVNEYLNCQRLIVSGFKNNINQLLEDLKACEGIDGYNEAIRWSRQYAQQQAKAIQADLENRYGFEKAKEMMEPIIREACA